MLSRFELRRFRGVLPKLALIFAAMVPVFYGAIYLAANWDPFGRLPHLPVAVVNEDRPVMFENKEIHAGADFTSKLIEKRNFDWHKVSSSEAEDGLLQGRYYLTVRVPGDFSEKLISGATDDPSRAGIQLRRNDANGFVIGSVVGRAQDSIAEAVNQSAEESYFEAVFANLAKIRAGMVEARDGSAQLRDGSRQAKDGSAQLRTGANDAADAGHRLHDGARQLDDGMGELSSGADRLSGGLHELSSGSARLRDGADQVAGGTQTLYDTVAPKLKTVDETLPQIKSDAGAINTDIQSVTGTVSGQSNSISSDLSSIGAALDQLERTNPAVSGGQGYRDARQRLTQAQDRVGRVTTTSRNIANRSASINAAIQDHHLSDSLSTAQAKLGQLNDGAHQVARGADDLHNGIDKAAQGAGDLRNGITKAKGGSAQLATGSGQLADGLDKLKDGVVRLDDGNGQLLDGATRLNQGLSDGVNRLPVLSPEQTQQAVQVLSQPTDVNTEVLNPAGVYGRGLAPLFFSIATWVFGISGFLVMRPISGRLLAGRLHPARLMLSAWVPFASVAVVGAVTMLATVWITLGLNPVHGVGVFLLTVFVALTFSLIAHTLRIALNLPGSAILLVWLILQLACTGGTYPRELLPPVFQWFNPIMPLTYSIDAFRITISGGLTSHLIHDVIVLGVFALLALLADVTAVAARQRFRMTDLHPPLQH